MPIIVRLDDLLHARRMTLTELAERVDITLANLSILKTGKAKAMRFSTLEAICEVLECQPGDLSLELEQLLRWASWVLSLPVIFFSCAPFFANAWRDILHRRISMDLPVALGMLITFAVSTAGTFDPTGTFGHEVFFDSLTMFGYSGLPKLPL